MPDHSCTPVSRIGRLGLSRRGDMVLVLLVSLLSTSLLMVWSYRAKLRCGGPPFFPDGRSIHWPTGDPNAVLPCYSDLMYLWVGRDINNHVFPYIHGGITPDGKLFGGVVEYPVLSGMFMWLGAIGAHTDTDFFRHSVALLIPFALVITVMLAAMTRWSVLWWALTPPLVLYAFHNWELPVVATAVGAVAVMAWGSTTSPRTGERRLSVRTAAVIAAILCGVGFCLKLYPGFFVLPLAVYVLTHRCDTASPRARPTGLDRRGAAWTVAAATATVVVIQLPFMLFGFAGWRAALSFQGRRRSDLDTNSIWYWGLRHFTGGANDVYNSVVGIASPVLIVAAFAVSMWLGWRIYRRDGVFPWIAVSASMLAGFLLFHKVHSPQYTLWLLPFFVLLRVRPVVIVAYLLGDFLLDTTIFRLIYPGQTPVTWWVVAGIAVGVWLQAVLLGYLIITFVRTPLREPLASFGNRRSPSAEPERVPALA